MAAWNVQEFRTLCEGASNDGVRFAESLAVRFCAARDYHQTRILDKLAEAKSKPAEAPRLDHEVAWELDSFMNALNSMFDFLAQLVNECLCVPKIRVSDVGLNESTIETMACRSLPEDLCRELRCITKKEAFQRIRSYWNVSKHHYAIKGDIHLDFRDVNVRTAYHSKPFDYKATTGLKICDADLRDFLEFVGSAVDRVGCIMNEKLRPATARV